MDIKENSGVFALFGRGTFRHKNNSGLHSQPLPEIVRVVLDSAEDWLRDRGKEIFNGVDDSLFVSAEKSHIQEDQDALFHALRLLRIEKDRLIGSFVANVAEHFYSLAAETPPGGNAGLSSDELALIHNDELEQQVAAKTIVANACRSLAEPIAELSLRLDTLLPQKIYDESMPLAPGIICQAFLQSLQPLDIQLCARITLLKKFQQLLACRLGELYEVCNLQLMNAGVLPSLKNPLRQSGHKAAISPSRAGSGTVAPDAKFSGEASSASNQYPPGLVPYTSGAMPLPTTDLLQHLGELQILFPLPAVAGGQLLNVNSLLEERLIQARQSASLDRLDSEVIRMVDMLFSFMLEDRNLAEPIKTQLVRLQLPLLKIAVADRSFFDKSGHPARRLLNEMADAAIAWQPGENFRNESLYCEILRVVDEVLARFDRDEKLFSELLESFQEFCLRERKRAQVMERRTVDEAQGRARVEAARARVSAVFDALIGERQLPKVIEEWLNRVWNSVLFRSCLHEGTQSHAWRQQVLTARELVWSAVAPMPESSGKLQRLLPDLRKRLQEGAESLSLTSADKQRLFHELDAVYRERQALAERVESERERRTRERFVNEFRREEGRAGDQLNEFQSNETQASEPQPNEAELPDVDELQQLAVDAQFSGSGDLKPLAKTSPHWQQTYHLKDSWFLLSTGEGIPTRCRLAALIKALDQFMFVNRIGNKVAVYTRLQLAHALKDRLLVPLDKGPIFERALQHVVGKLGETGIDAKL